MSYVNWVLEMSKGQPSKNEGWSVQGNGPVQQVQGLWSDQHTGAGLSLKCPPVVGIA